MISHTHAPTVEEIGRISRIDDPVIRNLQITQCYHELSRAISGVTGQSANWCTFATWASKQAGLSIRREDLIRAFEYQFHRSPETGLAIKALARYATGLNLHAGLKPGIEIILRAVRPEEIFNRVSDAVARGNKKVFEEISPVFARFLAEFRNDSVPDPQKISGFCTMLQSGDPPEGQGYLRDAFKACYTSCFTTEPKAKDELLFYANLLVGYHEQTRLQPEIAEALNAPFRNAVRIRDRLLEIALPGFWLRTRHKISRFTGRELPLDRAVDRLINQVQFIARRVTTEHLMTLQLAQGEILRLGRDLERPFPGSLSVIEDPGLIELLSRVDPTPDSHLRSGATDWADFDERIHFIADFFRTYHNRRTLFDPPYTIGQVNDLKSGRLPAGKL